MTYAEVKRAQKTYGYADVQASIFSGQIWRMEGSAGRHAMSLLESGACMLPTEAKRDYYGNRIPSRKELKAGSKGTFQNCANFWSKVEAGEIWLDGNEPDEEE